MPRPYIYVAVICVLLLFLITIIRYLIPNDPIPDQITPGDEIPNAQELDSLPTDSESDPDNETIIDSSQDVQAPNMASGESGYAAPMTSWTSRVTKKTFGTYVTPTNSPVSPEKFTGFHAAIDLEILPGEEAEAVPVNAICTGDLAVKRTASGYGGLVAQYCDYQGSPILVLYGHVSLRSVTKSVGDQIMAGEQLGVLGQPGPETDGERKHLHLGVRRSHDIVIAGYVPNQTSLSSYYDPRELLP